jgi:hypothetical protein
MNANRRLKIQTLVALVERILTETNASAVNIQHFLSFFLVVDNRMRKKSGVKTTGIEAATAASICAEHIVFAMQS